MNHLKLYEYPKKIQRIIKLRDDSKVLLRPIKPSDTQIWLEFYKSLSVDTKYLRFFVYPPEPDQRMIDRFTKIDYVNNFAIVAIITKNGKEKIIGVVRYFLKPLDSDSADLAIVVADEWQNKGLGTKMLFYLLWIMKKRKIKKVQGDTFLRNKKILQLMRESGFKIFKKDSYGERHFEFYL